MQKHKRSKVVLVALVIFSLATMFTTSPTVKAAGLDSAKDTISDSDLSATATHVFTLDLGTSIVDGQYIRIDFVSNFSGLNKDNATCPGGGEASSTGLILDCEGAVSNAAPVTLTITGVTNPGASTHYPINITTLEADGVTEIEKSQVMVYVIDDVKVTATVNATLSFSISGLGPQAGVTAVNGQNLTASSTSTALPFGTITNGVKSTVGQELAVTTNADDGFIVTVQQDGELQSGAGATINSFINSPDGTGSTSPETWVAPTAVLDVPETYGHMGLTTDDANLAAADFTGGKYAGLNGTQAMTIMDNDGPANGSTQNEGIAHVAYTIETSALQEAGDYESYLTYVCTPTY